MEELIDFCKATTKEIESSVFFKLARTEVLKFNRRIDVARAHAAHLDQLTQRYFSKMSMPNDRNNSMAPYEGSVDGTSAREMRRKQRNAEFATSWAERHRTNTKESRRKECTGEINSEEDQTATTAGEIGRATAAPRLLDEDSADHFVPRRLFLFKVENFKAGGRPSVVDEATKISPDILGCTSSSTSGAEPETCDVMIKMPQKTDEKPTSLGRRIKRLFGFK